VVEVVKLTLISGLLVVSIVEYHEISIAKSKSFWREKSDDEAANWTFVDAFHSRVH
jgi:hypothetical protein